jgi:hypothetical protein
MGGETSRFGIENRRCRLSKRHPLVPVRAQLARQGT